MPSALTAALDPAAREIVSLNVPFAPGNPYQQLFYCDETAGIRYQQQAELKNLDPRRTQVLHLHWDDRLFARDRSRDANLADLAEKIGTLTGFKEGGGKILWTAHNRLPHRLVDAEAFHLARQAIVDIADAIHVHSPHARDYLIETYDARAERITVIPHPSYLGAYEPEEVTLTRPFDPGEQREFLFFGMFRGQKGPETLEEAARKLNRRDAKYRLRMYGKAFPRQRKFLTKLEENPNVDLRTERVPDEDVAEVFAGAHVYVSPFREVFSSGTTMLATTFGLPIIAPDIREVREITPEENHCFLYDPDGYRALLRKLLWAISLEDEKLEEHRQASLRFARRHAPEASSRALMELIARLAD